MDKIFDFRKKGKTSLVFENNFPFKANSLFLSSLQISFWKFPFLLKKWSHYDCFQKNTFFGNIIPCPNALHWTMLFQNSKILANKQTPILGKNFFHMLVWAPSTKINFYNFSKYQHFSGKFQQSLNLSGKVFIHKSFFLKNFVMMKLSR